jgi:hypothetical protein
MNNDALAKITMINGSLRCFAFGLLALLPGIGIPFAIVSLWTAGQVRGLEKKYWNAAGPYRTLGVICAAVGLIFWFVVVALIAFNAAASDGGGDGLYGGDE